MNQETTAPAIEHDEELIDAIYDAHEHPIDHVGGKGLHDGPAKEAMREYHAKMIALSAGNSTGRKTISTPHGSITIKD